jgi:hypothetical protein
MWSYPPIRMSTLPLAIHCRTDGEVAIAPIVRFNTFYDRQEDGRYVIISQDEITLADGEELAYNVFHAYKQMPSFLSWLKSLQMEAPRFQ